MEGNVTKQRCFGFVCLKSQIVDWYNMCAIQLSIGLFNFILKSGVYFKDFGN